MSSSHIASKPERTPMLSEASPSTTQYEGMRWWRPITLKFSILTAVLIATLFLLGFVLLLHVQDYIHGAILYSGSNGTFSTQQLFLFRYLPIILLVSFGVLVSVIDLDIRRLEPWYQLSAEPKPTATRPILCRYDTDFVLGVVLHSFRRRHWAVFCAALSVVLTTIILPAVQNSMFTTRIWTTYQTLDTSAGQSLISPTAQLDVLTTNFLNTAYGVLWLGQGLPPFTTMEYALAKFALPSIRSNSRNSTVTAQTVKYWTELNCWYPSSIVTNTTTNTTSFDDGKGCFASDMVSFKPQDLSPCIGLYQGSYFGSQDNYGLRYPDSTGTLRHSCPQFPHRILLTWLNITSADYPPDFAPGGNASVSFCEPEYYWQQVNATIDAMNGSVVALQPVGDAHELLDEAFNRTNFETILTNGQSLIWGASDNLTSLQVDIADGLAIVQDRRLSNTGVSKYTGAKAGSSAMVGFALAASQSQPDILLQPEKLQQTFGAVHKLNFALAMSHVLAPGFQNSSRGLLKATEDTVHILPAFAIGTELLLVCIAGLYAVMLYYVPKRFLALKRDPESLFDVARLSGSSILRDLFVNLDGTSEKQLNTSLRDLEFWLSVKDTAEPVLSCSAPTLSVLADDLRNGAGDHKGKKLESPFEISGGFLVVIISLLGGSIIALTVLKMLADREVGLSMPSSQILQQILLNLIPTAFATLLSSYMTLLCRTYSFLKPLHDLHLQNAIATRTLSISYTSSLPTLLFLKSKKARHYLLTAMSLVTLISGTILTVTIASLFLSDEATASTPASLLTQYQPSVSDQASPQSLAAETLSSGSNIDAIYTTVANATESTKLPPWTTVEYAFLPLDLQNDQAQAEISQFEFEAMGYGADLHCIDLQNPPSNVAAELAFKPYQNNWLVRLEANYTEANGDSHQCWFLHRLIWDDGFGQIYGDISSDSSAFELSNKMAPVNTSSIADFYFCGNQTVKGWIRGHVQESLTSYGMTIQNLIHNATLVSCSSRLRMRQHILHTTPQGDILSAEPIAPLSYDIPNSVNLNLTLNTIIVSTGGDYNEPGWHNDTVARDWSNYVYKKMLNSTDLLDATKPLPSFEDASKFMSDAFSRLFAVQLSFDRKYLKLVNASTNASLFPQDTSFSSDKGLSPAVVPAKAYFTTRRIFISKPNFFISMAILCMDLAVLIVFRIRRPKSFLPRMPFTIASQIAYFSASHVIDDVVAAGGDCKVLDQKDYRYGHGKFIGKDGRVHIGIERQEFIIEHLYEKKEQKTSKRSWWRNLWPSSHRNRRGSVRLKSK